MAHFPGVKHIISQSIGLGMACNQASILAPRRPPIQLVYLWRGSDVSVNNTWEYVSNYDSYNWLSPVQRQAITWSSDDVLSIGPLEIIQWNLKQTNIIFIGESVCKMAAILSQSLMSLVKN